MVEIVILHGLAVMYLTNTLFLEEKTSHEGPLDFGKFVEFHETGHLQRFTLFDLVRYVLGVYFYKPVSTDTYRTRGGWWYEMWTCSDCLSFWMAIPFTLLLIGRPIDELLVIHFATACISFLGNRYVRMSKE